MAEHIARNAHSNQPPFAKRLQAHVELADPVTWITPITMVICGALASGRGSPGFQITQAADLLWVTLAALMCGPLGTGFSQSINDYFDRDLDAINDPSRPIPSQRVSLGAARTNWIILGLGTFVVGLILMRQSIWLLVLSVLSIILSAAYSVPPVKLKQHFWLGAPAVGLGYVFLSWAAGHLTFAPMSGPSLILALINSFLAAGLLFLNDIKSLEGDRTHGLQSMTVALGVRRTLVVSYLIIGACELLLLLLSLWAGYLWATVVLTLALAIPIYSQVRLYREPTHKNFLRYIIASNPFVLIIQFVSAFIVGGYFR
ncbi:MAG: UbiA family prenyltransferase [Oscillochloris sp.]|nr:UbiA family prenyltransferase [Oscillochloris sp.]